MKGSPPSSRERKKALKNLRKKSSMRKPSKVRYEIGKTLLCGTQEYLVIARTTFTATLAAENQNGIPVFHGEYTQEELDAKGFVARNARPGCLPTCHDDSEAQKRGGRCKCMNHCGNCHPPRYFIGVDFAHGEDRTVFSQKTPLWIPNEHDRVFVVEENMLRGYLWRELPSYKRKFVLALNLVFRTSEEARARDREINRFSL